MTVLPNLSRVDLRTQVALRPDPFDPADPPVDADWIDLTDRVRSSDARLSGGQPQLDSTQAGELRIPLLNPDGAFDPDNPQSPYAGKIRPNRHIRQVVKIGAAVEEVWTGFVARWPQIHDYKDVEVADLVCTDALGILAGGVRGRKLRRAYANEVLQDSPIGFYMLDEPEGSTSFGSIAPVQQPPATIRYSKNGAGTVTAGVDGLLPADPGTAVQLSGATTGGFVGAVVEFARRAGAGGPFLVNSGGWAIEFWARMPNAATTAGGFLLRQAGTLTTLGGDWLIEQAVDGKLTFELYGGAVSQTTAAEYDDNLPHHVVFTMASNGLTWKVFVDGVQVLGTTEAGGAAFSAAGDGWIQAGGAVGAPHHGTFTNGTWQAVAFYQHELSSARVGAHYDAGRTAFAGETSGDRAGRILDWAGWVGPTSIDAGLSVLSGASTVDGQNPALALQDVAKWEAGSIVATRDGTIRFASRSARWNTAPVCTFGDRPGLGEIPYAVLETDEDRVVNDLEVERIGGGKFARVNEPSIEVYGPQEFRLQLGVETDLEAIDRLNYMYGRHGESSTMIRRLVIKAHAIPGHWLTLLRLAHGNRVTVNRRPDPFRLVSKECHIEQVSHSFTKNLEWLITLMLSPAEPDTYWQLGVSALGVDTKLAY